MYRSRQNVLTNSDATADVDCLMNEVKVMHVLKIIIVCDFRETYAGTLGGSKKMRKLCKSTVMYISF